MSSAKLGNIELKTSEYDQMGYLIKLRRPSLTLSNLTLLTMAYHKPGLTQTQLSLGLAKPNLFQRFDTEKNGQAQLS